MCCAQDEMVQHQCKHKNMEVWQRAVDTQRFNPRFRSLEMRHIMSEGHPEAPLLVYVGRLGAGELACQFSGKSLKFVS